MSYIILDNNQGNNIFWEILKMCIPILGIYYIFTFYQRNKVLSSKWFPIHYKKFIYILPIFCMYQGFICGKILKYSLSTLI